MPYLSSVIGNYNGQFIGNSSAKPIVGVCLSDLYKGNVQQARVSPLFVGQAYQGAAVTIKNEAVTGTKAGEGLNPNVLEITAYATSQATLSGFILEAPNMLLPDSSFDAAPVAPAYAITNVALLGSGVEIYLPAAANLVNAQVGSPSLVWDFTNKCVATPAKTTDPTYLTAISPVVDGLIVKYDSTTGNQAAFVAGKVIKVKL